MELVAQAGRGIVKIFQAAEDGESRAYWMAGFMAVYIVAATGFLVYSWTTTRSGLSKRKLIGYTLAYAISIGFAGFILFGILSRLLQ